MGTGFFGNIFKGKQDGPLSSETAQARRALRDERTRQAAAPQPAPEPPAPTAAPTASPEQPKAAPHEPTSLDRLLQDRVVVRLLKEEIVDVPRALMALRRQGDHPTGALWRVIADDADVDREAVLAVAAGVLDFRTANVTSQSPPTTLIQAVLGLFSPEQQARALLLGLLPCELHLDTETGRSSMTLATPDPDHPDVWAFIETLPLAVELRFAPTSAVMARIHALKGEGGHDASPATRPAAKAAPAPEPVKGPACPMPAARRAPETAAIRPPMPAPVEQPVRREPRPIPVREPQPAETKPALARTDYLPEGEMSITARIDKARADHLYGDGYGSAEPPEPAPAKVAGPPEEKAPVPPAFTAPAEEEEPESEAPVPAEEAAPPAEEMAEEPAEKLAEVESESPDPVNLDAIKSKDRVVGMLLRREIVTPKHVGEAQALQKAQKSKEALWRTLAQVGGVDRDAVYAEAARVYAFPVAKLGEGLPDAEFARSVIDTFTEEKKAELFKLRVLPFECDIEHQTGAIKLVFITHDPTRPEVHRLMQQLKLERFELRYAPEGVVVAGLQEAYPRKNEYLERMNEGGEMAFDLGASYDEKAHLIDEDALEAEISRSSLINLFEATLVEGVRQGASDIHIYPNAQKKIEIHFRIDGRLTHWHTEDKVHPEALLAVIKDNATNVDRFERDAAQDGFIQRWVDEALIRFRVSVLPIANASQEIRSESIVIRILDDRKVVTDLKKLGLLGNALSRFDKAIRQPHGMVILTGPTGSGKSTTLVAALHQVVTPEVNVLTVEDPVEYIIPGVRQIKLNHKLGLEEALRSILRHDPDVVMVGEMRDKQTAELAIKLANTGHLTFSTLHTNDAPSAVSRLYKMGIEPFLIAYAINLVVAQRLIRTLCPECKVPDTDPDEVMLSKLGFTDEDIQSTTIYEPGHDPNCKTCKGTGYKGRKAVTEALYFSRGIRHMIVESTKMIDEDKLRTAAAEEGMLTLADSAREYVKAGDTGVMEMIRVVTTET